MAIASTSVAVGTTFSVGSAAGERLRASSGDIGVSIVLSTNLLNSESRNESRLDNDDMASTYPSTNVSLGALPPRTSLRRGGSAESGAGGSTDGGPAGGGLAAGGAVVGTSGGGPVGCGTAAGGAVGGGMLGGSVGGGRAGGGPVGGRDGGGRRLTEPSGNGGGAARTEETTVGSTRFTVPFCGMSGRGAGSGSALSCVTADLAVLLGSAILASAESRKASS